MNENDFESISGLIDFNDADDQRSFVKLHGYNPHYLDELKKRMNQRAEEILVGLYPNGFIERNEFLIGNKQGSPGRSMKISLKPGQIGMGADFATGERFGDLISVWAAAHNLDIRGDFEQILKDIENYMSGDSKQAEARFHRPTREQIQKRKRKGPPFTKTGESIFNYTDPAGNLLVEIRRRDGFNPETGQKAKQFAAYDHMTGEYKMPAENRPLYNLPAVVQEDWVVVVEGEKKVDALQTLGVVATTAMGGSNTRMDLVDWSPLWGKGILIWPDRDLAGWMYANNLADYLRRHGFCRSIKILEPPAEKPGRWDAADAVSEGFNVVGFLQQAIESDLRAFRAALPAAGDAADAADAGADRKPAR